MTDDLIKGTHFINLETKITLGSGSNPQHSFLSCAPVYLPDLRTDKVAANIDSPALNLQVLCALLSLKTQ